MFDEQTLGSLPEVPQEETQETLVQETQPAQEKPQDTAAIPQESFKQLRDKAEKAERERDELYRKLKAYESAQSNTTDEDINIGADELAEGKHLNKVQQKIKKLEAKINQYEQQSTNLSVEAKLRNQYPDFEQVVSKDNLDLLSASYPEVYNTLRESQDIYSKAVSAYTMIKKLGIMPQDTFKEEKEIIQRNTAKPKPLASVSPQQGDSPLSRANAFANGLTDELKAQLRKEMEEARRNM